MKGWQLQQRQSLPLEAKIVHTKDVIRKWYEHWDGDVYVSFSGGIDSTVLLHIVREMYPKIPAMFIDTGLEYPENKEFVNSKRNVIAVRPRKGFRQVIDEYGYPVISKEQSRYIYEARTTSGSKLRHTRLYGNKWGQGKVSEKWKFLIDAPFKISDKCCYHLKKAPAREFERNGLHPMLGNLAAESHQRVQEYLRFGCNAFDVKRPVSKPLSIWTSEDIWEYIRSRNIAYSKLYDKGYERSGCMFCMFGLQKEELPNKFQVMKRTHPKIWRYCICDLGLGEVLDYVGIPYGKYSRDAYHPYMNIISGQVDFNAFADWISVDTLIALCLAQFFVESSYKYDIPLDALIQGEDIGHLNYEETISEQFRHMYYFYHRFRDIPDPLERYKFALASYQIGMSRINNALKVARVMCGHPERLSQWKKKGSVPGQWQTWDYVSPILVEIFPFAKETLEYVAKVFDVALKEGVCADSD